jgi:hypothetical protein
MASGFQLLRPTLVLLKLLTLLLLKLLALMLLKLLTLVLLKLLMFQSPSETN